MAAWRTTTGKSGHRGPFILSHKISASTSPSPSNSTPLAQKKRKRDEPTGEEEVEGRRVAKQPRKKVEVDMNKHSMDSEVEMSDMEAVVHQSTLYDELYRAYMLLREPLD